MVIIRDPLALAEIKSMAERTFGNFVKAVVDIERKEMAIDGELHSDEEALLLEDGSDQENLWGINIYPEIDGPDRIEFDSVINIRPSQNNRTRGVDDPEIRDKIVRIISTLIKS